MRRLRNPNAAQPSSSRKTFRIASWRVRRSSLFHHPSFFGWPCPIIGPPPHAGGNERRPRSCDSEFRISHSAFPSRRPPVVIPPLEEQQRESGEREPAPQFQVRALERGRFHLVVFA